MKCPTLWSLLLVVVAALSLQAAPAGAQILAGRPAAVMTAGKVDPCPSATVCANFTQGRYKAGGVITSSFAALPGLTVTRATGGYAEDQTGALTWFNSGQARITNKGLLVEEARTNLILQSGFASGWSLDGVTTALNADIAPDGTQTAMVATETATTANHAVSQVSSTITAGATVTGSYYLKPQPGGRDYARIVVANAVSPTTTRFAQCVIQVSAQKVVFTGQASYTPPACTITPQASGSYRITLTTTTATDTAVALWLSPLPTATASTYAGSTSFYQAYWGPQLEVGAFATSYIPTTSAAATRPADDIRLSSPFTDLSAGAAYVRAAYPRGISAANPRLLGLSGANLLALSGTNGIESWNGTSSLSRQASAGSWVYGTTIRAAVTWATGSRKLNVNGIAADMASDANPMGAGLTAQIMLGSWANPTNTANPLNSYIEQVGLYARTLGDAELVQLAGGNDLSSLSLDFARGLYKTTTPYVRTNLALQSGDFSNAAFSAVSGLAPAVTGSAGVAPDGTNTAALLTFSAQFQNRGQALSVTNGAFYTVSFWAKWVSGNTQLHILDTGTSAFFSPITVDSTWRRFSFTVAADRVAQHYSIQDRNAAGFGSVLVWGLQVEPATAANMLATSYIATTTAAASVATTQSTNLADIGALSFTNATGGYVAQANGTLTWFPPNTPRITDLGLLVEESRTNAYTWSSDLTNANWIRGGSGTGMTFAAGQAAPDGTNTAILATTTGATLSYLGPVAQPAIATGLTTRSIHAKAGTSCTLIFEIVGGVTGSNASFNLCTGVATSGANMTASLKPLGSGWYLASSSYTTTVANAGGTFYVESYGTAAAGKSMYFWGPQLELGAFATSYIPTTTASATRAADVAKLAYTPTGVDGTFGVAANPSSFSNTPVYLNHDAATSAGIYSGNTGNHWNGATAVGPTGTITTGLTNNLVLAYTGTTQRKLSVNGSAVTTSATTVGTINVLQLGGAASAPTQTLNGYLSQVRIYPYAANDNELTYRSAGNW